MREYEVWTLTTTVMLMMLWSPQMLAIFNTSDCDDAGCDDDDQDADHGGGGCGDMSLHDDRCDYADHRYASSSSSSPSPLTPDLNIMVKGGL